MTKRTFVLNIEPFVAKNRIGCGTPISMTNFILSAKCSSTFVTKNVVRHKCTYLQPLFIHCNSFSIFFRVKVQLVANATSFCNRVTFSQKMSLVVSMKNGVGSKCTSAYTILIWTFRDETWGWSPMRILCATKFTSRKRYQPVATEKETGQKSA